MKPFILLVLAIFLQSTSLFAQKAYSVKSRKAIKYYKKGMNLINGNTPDGKRDFDNGTIYLQKAIKTAPNFVEAHIQLAQNAMLFQQFKQQEFHYSEIVRIAPSNEKYVQIYFSYGKLLMKQKRYQEAIEEFGRVEQFPKKNKKLYEKAVHLKANSQFAIEAIKNAYPLELIMLDKATVNRFVFQSHPILTGDQQQMIYSARNAQRHSDENIVISNKENGNWTRSTSISPNINTVQNEGFATISSDGKTLIFTACDRPNNVGSCDLYISRKNGDDWSEPENMGPEINSTNWDSEPSLSSDGRILYFSSNRKGGFGGRDIWYTTLGENGKWQKPHNLGAPINTKYHEVTPFIHFDNEHLYFASLGHVGLGGYDLFVSTKANKKWQEPKNLGSPINTEHNEGSLFITPDYKKAYFEKFQQEGRYSHAEIFEFDFPKQLQPEFKCSYAKGIVYDKVSEKPIGATVELIDLVQQDVNQLVKADDKNGEYLVILTEGKEFALSVQKEGYLFYSEHFDFSKATSNSKALDIYLEPISKGKKITLQNVFFETDKYDLKEKSFAELNKVVALLKKNATLKIEISGHTDNVGSKSHNLTLSKNRAKAVYDYLISKGINSQQIKYVGKGASQPIDDNNTTEGKAKNRRIEIKVI